MDSLTGLRWFAAFGVFLFHTYGYAKEAPALMRLMSTGYEGVVFFFVLSGFVMAWVARPEDTPARYYWRRFARIWPLLAVTTLVFAVLEKEWLRLPVSTADVVWTLTLAQAWSTDHFYSLNIVTWTLSVEAFFYLLFPFLFRLLTRCRSGALVALAALTPVVTAATHVVAPRLDLAPETARLVTSSPLSLTPMFVLGVCAALLVRRGHRPPFGSGTALALTAGSLFLGWLWLGHPGAVPWLVPKPGALDALVMPSFAVLITTAAVGDLRGRRSLPARRPLVRLGEWSFAFYVCHLVMLRVFRHLGLGPGPGLRADALAVALALLTTLALAALLHEYLEKPAERRLRALLPARTRAV
ncbi:acyltransferase family protein [Streptomyces sp. NPDC012637]|uniref:acyltransferase family protein n=1 Tax=Streptomyces sp. NPDC012637 TaxID=3364842 RepID=UPI0036E02907